VELAADHDLQIADVRGRRCWRLANRDRPGIQEHAVSFTEATIFTKIATPETMDPCGLKNEEFVQI